MPSSSGSTPGSRLKSWQGRRRRSCSARGRGKYPFWALASRLCRGARAAGRCVKGSAWQMHTRYGERHRDLQHNMCCQKVGSQVSPVSFSTATHLSKLAAPVGEIPTESSSPEAAILVPYPSFDPGNGRHGGQSVYPSSLSALALACTRLGSR